VSRDHKTIIPTVHLNGTSLEVLIQSRVALYDTLQDSIRRLERMEPHPRDYPERVTSDPIYKDALKQHHRRWRALIAIEKSVREEIEALSEIRETRREENRKR
jgi:hypothetical protein